MRTVLRVAFLISGGMLALPAQGSRLNWTYAEGWFVNALRAMTNAAQIDQTTNGTIVTNLDSRSMSIWSAGNVNTAASAPTATFLGPSGIQTVSLIQSACGQIVAGSLGYSGA